jgi:hypothetical protein
MREPEDEGTTRAALIWGIVGYALDVAGATLLGIASITAALAAYRGSQWGGEVVQRFTDGTVAINDANTSAMHAVQTAMMDSLVWMAVLEQEQAGNSEMSQYFLAKASPAFVEAVAWVGEAPEGEDRDPFDHPPYAEGLFADAEALGQRGEQAIQSGIDADDNGDSFDQVGIVLTLATFLAGMAPVMTRIPLKLVFLVAGGLVWTVATMWMLTLQTPG